MQPPLPPPCLLCLTFPFRVPSSLDSPCSPCCHHHSYPLPSSQPSQDSNEHGFHPFTLYFHRVPDHQGAWIRCHQKEQAASCGSCRVSRGGLLKFSSEGMGGMSYHVHATHFGGGGACTLWVVIERAHTLWYSSVLSWYLGPPYPLQRRTPSPPLFLPPPLPLCSSERIGKTGATGTLLTEATCINLSLHYLEQVQYCRQGATPTRGGAVCVLHAICTPLVCR